MIKDRIFIIAEAGVNHNSDMDIARKMIDVAVEAGADAVKFQTFKAENLVSRFAPKAEYQKKTTDSNESQFDMIKSLELDYEAHKELSDYCADKKIVFLSTPFDLDSIDTLRDLGIVVWKIPSGEITNLPYLRKIASFNQQVILSTGMSKLGEVEEAVNILEAGGTERGKITVLHCNTEYPTPFEDANLNSMLTIKEALKVNIGYSDHTLGITLPIAAAALGATVIEKHFTLDKKMAGPDHRASLEPGELKEMVQAIRNIEVALGDGIKKPSRSESRNIMVARKSIVASKDIKAGDIFSSNNLTVKRPGSGINPMEWDNILGRKASKDFKRDELIQV